jgi:hypothetical protein
MLTGILIGDGCVIGGLLFDELLGGKSRRLHVASSRKTISHALISWLNLREAIVGILV